MPVFASLHLCVGIWSSSLWERIQLDFTGPFEGHMYLVVVDVHSKWLEMHIMDNTTANKTIQVLGASSVVTAPLMFL